MAATTTLLDLVTPTQGTLSGTWGDTVNYGISDYLDIAIAGTLSFAGDGAITLTNTIGSASGNNIGSTTAQYMVIRVTGTLTTPKIITAPSRSKLYLVDNAATGSTVSFIRSGQTPAVSIAVGEKAFVFFNGTDYVKIAGTTSGSAGGSNTQVQFNSSGALAGSANLTFSGTTLTLQNGYYEAYDPADTTSAGYGMRFYTNGGGTKTENGRLVVAQSGTGSALSSMIFQTNNGTTLAEKVRITGAGNVGIGTSSPSAALELARDSADVGLYITRSSTGASNYRQLIGGDGDIDFRMVSSKNMRFFTNDTERARIDAVGNFLVGGTAARGTTVGTAHLDLFNGTAPAGTLTNGISLYSDSGDLKFMNAAGQAFDVGYRNIPQNSQSADYTLTLADAGDHIFHPVGDNNARTFTIPANSSVAYPIGTAITFINMAAANVTIAITSDTMYLSSAGTTGSRTLAQYGSATAIKITSTNWLISGSGLT
jgi:hypothetical protein